jgi:hypothetical protein
MEADMRSHPNETLAPKTLALLQELVRQCAKAQWQATL